MKSRRIEIGWGRRPRWIDVPGNAVEVSAPPSPPPMAWSTAVEAALLAPIGSPPLAALCQQVRRVCVIVPDDTRKDVAGQLLPLIRPHLGAAAVTVVVASGKHPPGPAPAGGFSHDARAADLVPVGRTAWGTEVAYPPAVLDADLRVLLGEIRPHYFAGYAGGAKLLFPGVAAEAGIWHNHRLKAAPGARLGVVDGNPCRADMEAAAALAGPAFIVNIVRGLHGEPVFAVAGDPIAAHREGARRAGPIFECTAPGPVDVVLVSDRHPVTMNLYQACKLLPPAGPLLAEGGTIIVAAECADGIGPVEVINEAIYRLGSVHSLPAKHRVLLVSSQPP
ncbi:MAG: DUF2088 domain-containing protein, partial [Myxococcales bacterium]|nr:DUF2088 domain-containing protein [Myxococcales bacterium]